MTFSFQKKAEEELLNQLLYYRDIHQELSQEFNLRVQETINRILDFPKAWSVIDEHNTRRALVNGFPFGILYQYDEKQAHIRIIAVMNTGRKPGYWKNRK